MRRVEERFTCKDDAGRLYTSVVLVSHRWVFTLLGPAEAVRPREYWLEFEDMYTPVKIIRPLVKFEIIETGTILQGRRESGGHVGPSEHTIPPRPG